MVLVDLYCDKCGFTLVDKMVDTKESSHGICEKCGGVFRRKCGFGSFELKYDPRTDSCDFNGNSSQYWNQVREKGSKTRHNGKEEPSKNGMSRGDKWF